MTLRALRRAAALLLALFLVFVRYWSLRLGGPMTLERRALWLHWACRLVASALGIEYRVEGAVPGHGLVVSNHLSYLDIVLLSAAMPCFFVAKAEISRWPYFGRAASAGGTLFLDRSSLASAEQVSAMIGERLRLPVPVLLFPEGTSTDGSEVLRFHSRLFEPAVQSRAPVTAASVRYLLAGGRAERELCWFGDESFLPHLWKTLGARGFSAVLGFGEPAVYSHRREAADQTHDQIVAMRAEEAVAPPAGEGSQDAPAGGGAVESRSTRLVETRNSRPVF